MERLIVKSMKLFVALQLSSRMFHDSTVMFISSMESSAVKSSSCSVWNRRKSHRSFRHAKTVPIPRNSSRFTSPCSPFSRDLCRYFSLPERCSNDLWRFSRTQGNGVRRVRSETLLRFRFNKSLGSRWRMNREGETCRTTMRTSPTRVEGITDDINHPRRCHFYGTLSRNYDPR